MTARFIAGDWGTTRLRLALCDETGRVLDEATGPGAAACASRFAEVYAQTVAPWSLAGPLPALLCGMVGSRQGWREAPYLRCPTGLEHIARGSIAVGAHGVRILPGLTCTNPLGVTDFLRGEETQLLGALALEPRLREGRHLVVLPGTHSKWLHLVDGQARHFQTAVTGEVYAALHAHSVLVTPSSATEREGTLEDALADAFALGLARARAASRDSLLAQLFECRTRRLTGELSYDDASAFLSGLLVGHEIAHGLSTFARDPAMPICLIGTAALARRYARALAAFDVDTYGLDGGEAAVAGLTTAYRQLRTEECVP